MQRGNELLFRRRLYDVQRGSEFLLRRRLYELFFNGHAYAPCELSVYRGGWALRGDTPGLKSNQVPS